MFAMGYLAHKYIFFENMLRLMHFSVHFEVFFSVLTKRICMLKTNFLRIYSNVVLEVILNCMNMQIATQLIMMYNL